MPATWATNNIETATERKLALYLRDLLPSDVTVVRSLVSSAPEAKRVTVLPGDAQALQVDLFLGSTGGRARRQDEFTVRTWVEVLGDDLEGVEDDAQDIQAAVENIAAEHPTLGDVDGLLMFGQQMQRTAHPMVELQPGLFYRWIETEISCTGRYN